MNIDQALNLALAAQHELQVLLREQIENGQVEIIISGAGGTVDPPDCHPDVGIHLSIAGEEAERLRNDILLSAQPIIARGVGVIVFPKPAAIRG
jgi:hypothetical protein